MSIHAKVVAHRTNQESYQLKLTIVIFMLVGPWMSRSITKPTKWPYAQRRLTLLPPSLISLCCLYELSSKDWSDCAKCAGWCESSHGHTGHLALSCSTLYARRYMSNGMILIQGLFWLKLFVRKKSLLVKMSETFSNLMRFFLSLSQNQWEKFSSLNYT